MDHNPKKLQRFRAALEVRRVELRRSIAQLEQCGRTPEDEAAADTLDRAGSSHSKDLLVHRIASERGSLRNVEAAFNVFGMAVSVSASCAKKKSTRNDSQPFHGQGTALTVRKGL